MREEKYTRCPECRTVFRVTLDQLAARGGQVRCGHCRTAFDGVDQLIDLAPPPLDDDDDVVVDDTLQGPPTVTLRRAPAPDPPWSAVEADAGDTRREPRVSVAAAEPPPAVEARGRSVLALALYALASVALVALLAGQTLFHYRDTVVARWPATKPLYTQFCAVAGCAIGAPHGITDLLIQASDLQVDPAHKGLLMLTALVRNRAEVALAYPHLELTLTDAQDQTVVRRVLLPAEYAGGTVDLAAGIPANGEIAVKVFIDASATTQAGYRLYLFYP